MCFLRGEKLGSVTRENCVARVFCAYSPESRLPRLLPDQAIPVVFRLNRNGVLQRGEEFHHVLNLEWLDQEGVGAELIAFVQQFYVGQAGEHNHDGPGRQMFVLEGAKDKRAVIRLHHEVEEDEESGASIFVGVTDEFDRVFGSFKPFDLVEQLAVFKRSPLSIKIMLRVID